MKSTQRTSLRGLRTFCVAARYGSFRTAGETLFVTASAVSHQIKTLEEELGLTLFDRSGRQLKLTEAGEGLAEELSPLLDRIDDIVANYKGDGARKSVRISVQPFFGSEYFVPRLSEFSALHPEIEIFVGSSDESAEKHPADVDLSIRLYSKPPSGVASPRLFAVRMATAGSPAFKKTIKLKGGKIISDFPLIVHETLPKAWQQWSEATGIELPEKSKVTRLESMIAVLRATQRGLGAALVPVPMGELWFTEGSVVRLFSEERESDRGYYVVWDEASRQRPEVLVFRDWILETFSANT